jgi:hypothetical protein
MRQPEWPYQIFAPLGNESRRVNDVVTPLPPDQHDPSWHCAQRRQRQVKFENHGDQRRFKKRRQGGT